MRTKVWAVLGCCSMVAGWTWAALADDVVPGQTTTQPSASHANHRPRTLGASETIFQSSKLAGMHVYNGDSADLGKINNLIVDAHARQVLYAIVSTGVFGKDIPVPWSAVQLATNDKEYWAVLNVTKDRFGTAPTFDKHDWSHFNNPQWKKSVEDFYGVRTVARPITSEGSATPSTQANTENASRDVRWMFESSELSGMRVYGQQDAKLGKLDDLIIDTRTGLLLYGILDTGIGGKSIPVPWSAVNIVKKTDKNDYWVVLDMSKDHLASAPTVNTKQLPDFTNMEWRRSVDQFFGARTATHPEPATTR
jgi:sporulation protein YlmC with PRC-barrel domain